MILFDLICENGHVFEAWFKDSEAFEKQVELQAVECPTCLSKTVSKALMAPNIQTSKQKKSLDQAKTETQHEALTTRQAIEELHKTVEKNFDYVGSSFAQEARKIHHGESESRNIYGETTPGEAKSLAEEGVSVLPLPPKTKSDA
ncbi:DUF1178 family protein [Kiloniella sp. b19]|uniref:DUF1178 family protein n=1 Tax=Kiloniella sp. GXU_MW_B19 TaxID=3141326 RepID=UPI0031D3463D